MDPKETSQPNPPVEVSLGDRTVYLLGTAHISQDSVEAVRRGISDLSPDTVCVELDGQRLEALRDPGRWRNLNLVAALRQGKGTFLLANLALSSFQRRMGLHTGVTPGAELLAAVQTAEEQGVPVALVDRPIRTTLLRAWRRTGFFKKMSLASTLLASAFEAPELDEADLAELQQKDTLSAMLEEVGEALPAAKRILIDERDTYMAAKIRADAGQRVLAVVGAGHVPGLTRELQREIPATEVAELDRVPPKPAISKVIPWLIPALVVGLFVGGFFFGDTSKLAGAAWAWILANGCLAALGAQLALGHPAAVAAAFVAAPLTSLNPTVGAGMVTGVVQAWAGKPRVQDMEHLLDDLGHWRGWWRNRVSRVLLVFFFSNLGSSIGTFVAFGWLKDLF
jgi:pheromone shutdown-related protein TraB